MERRPSIYQLLSGFFGLSDSYRVQIFSQIHEIVFHGNGGYTWTDVYNMPIWLRRFTFQKLSDFYDKENKKAQNHPTKSKVVEGPDIDPSYSSRASKK